MKKILIIFYLVLFSQGHLSAAITVLSRALVTQIASQVPVARLAGP